MRRLNIEIRDTESRDIYGCVRRGTYEDFPKIVCLCGSGRFREAFDQAECDETLAGRIVLTIGCNTKDVARDVDFARHKPALDDLHKRKIDLADEVFVLNVGGYIGDSTRSEIAYAQAQNKAVRYLERVEPEHFFDEAIVESEAFDDVRLRRGRVLTPVEQEKLIVLIDRFMDYRAINTARHSASAIDETGCEIEELLTKAGWYADVEEAK